LYSTGAIREKQPAVWTETHMPRMIQLYVYSH